MAGSKEIYIGEMLDEVVDNITALQSSMGNDFSELIKGFEITSEKQISAMQNIEKNLAQILSNTGLEKKQKVFTGSDLTAIPINSSKWVNYFEKNGQFSISNNVIETKAIGNQQNVEVIITNLQFANIKEICIATKSIQEIGQTAKMQALVKLSSGTILDKSIGYNQTIFVYDNIDVSGISDSNVYIKLNTNSSSDDMGYGLIFQISFKDYDGNLIELEAPIPVASSLIYVNSAITSTGSAYGYSEFNLTGENASQWSDIYCRCGNDVVVDVYDDNFSFVGTTVNGGANLVKLLSNKCYLFYRFSNAGNISSIAFRYF